MMFRILFFFLFVFANQFAWGQKLKAWEAAGDSALENGNYYAAYQYFEIALEYDSTKYENRFKMGEALWGYKAYEKAEKIFENVVEHDTLFTFPVARLRLAQIAVTFGEYLKGLQWLEEFKKSKGKERETYKDLADLLAQQCFKGIDPDFKSANVAVSLLPSSINTPESEFGIGLRGDTLYFSSFNDWLEKDKNNPQRKRAQILYLAPESSIPVSVDFLNDPEKITSHIAFAANGNYLYYNECAYIKEGIIHCDLFLRKKINGVYGNADTLSINYKGFSTTQPSVGYHKATGKEYLYFSSNRPVKGENKGFDIWVSEVLSDGNLSQPINLSNINTKGNEVTPHFNSESQNLYFSSDFRTTSLGGFDIFQTRIGQNPVLTSEPFNIGLPFNTTYDEYYFTIHSNASTAYFSSNRPGTEYLDVFAQACCNDIFKAEFSPQIELLVEVYEGTPQNRKAVDDALVLLLELDQNQRPKSNVPPAVDVNKYLFNLKQFGVYQLEINKSTFLPHTQIVDLTESLIFKDSLLILEVYLTKGLVDLQILTFDCESQKPLNQVDVVLVETAYGRTREVFPTLVRNDKQEYQYKSIPLNNEIRILAQRIGYQPTEINKTFTVEDIIEFGNQITFEVCLYSDPIPPLPFSLFFNNDEPGPKTLSTVSSNRYNLATKDYYDQKEIFVKAFNARIEEEDTLIAATRLRNFFDRDVLGGQITLNLFLEKLLPFLEEGNQLEIELQGYTSPRGDSLYNMRLAERRINSIVKEFEFYKRGALKRFFEKGTFKIKVLPIGEDPGIDPEIRSKLEDMNDDRNSIFSFSASFSRRVDIIGINITMVTTHDEN
jgi:tetratricopeptide (TPR) repeat protein